ncbi:MAG: gamma-glutamyl-gamma-aminobutyrate hydrolase family protein [Methylotenera sp.]
MKTHKRKPIVLIPADVKQIGEHPFHAVGQKYILAVAEAAGALPLLVPSISSQLEIEELLAIADGVMLTGSPSNVHPSHFGQSVLNPDLPLDPARDALTLKLVRAAVNAGVPLLAICRGFQELNVAFGGSLHQAVQEVADLNDHREVKDLPLDTQYAVAHAVKLVASGQLTKILGTDKIMVNSLHGQGVDMLGAGLIAEAHALDGLIEAVCVGGAKTFALGVQWHPEWKVMENPQYLAVFKAFGDACQARAQRHKPPD